MELRAMSSKSIARSLDLRVMDRVVRLRRKPRDSREDISWQTRRRQRRRLWSDSFGDMNAPADGRRFLGGNACGETAMNFNELMIYYQKGCFCFVTKREKQKSLEFGVEYKQRNQVALLFCIMHKLRVVVFDSLRLAS